MDITKVTITGADDNTNIDEMLRISDRFPFVEWGILFSASRQEQKRYPSNQWVARLVSNVPKNNFKLSAHLCGNHARTFAASSTQTQPIVELLRQYFDRFQINFNFKTSGPFDFDTIKKTIEMYPDNGFIFQANKSNMDVCEELDRLELRNINFLFDASGGRGTEIKNILPPFVHYTGYAGGLTPQNVSSFCGKLQASFPDMGAATCIDTETGVRTDDDEFDLGKVELFLENCEKFIANGK